MKSWQNLKLRQVIICSNLVVSTSTTPKYHVCPYLAYLPTFTTIYLYLALCSMNYHYLVIFALNCPDSTICAIFTQYIYSICAIFTQDIYSSILLCKIFESNRQLFMEILHFKELGDTERFVTNVVYQFMCLSSNWQFLVCTFGCFTPVSNCKAIGQLVMEILHFKDLGDTASMQLL